MVAYCSEFGSNNKATKVTRDRGITFHNELAQEIDVLQEIYIDELQIETSNSGQATCVTIKLYPATGECSDQKWVCLTLQLQLPDDYPTSVPSIHIRSPRGLTEECVNSLKKSLTLLADEKRGSAMLYDFIEHARESLTTGNVLQGQCMICLEELSASGSKPVFTQTSCYHFFHLACIYRYVEHCQREFEECREECKSISNPTAAEESFEAICPVCRESLPEEIVSSVDTHDLQDSIEADEEQFMYVPSAEIIEMQRKMSELCLQQLAKGGIIDLEAERNKYFIPKEGLVVPISHSADETINGATADGSEQLLETVNHPSSADQEADGLAVAKPAVPSGHKQNSGANRSSNRYASSRKGFSGSHHKYTDDYDDYDTRVRVHPRHYGDHKQKRWPKSARSTANAIVFNDPVSHSVDDMTDSVTAVRSEQLLETVKHPSSEDQEADGLAVAKLTVPSGHKQNNGANRSNNSYANSRNGFSGSNHKYRGDYDICGHPRHYRDHNGNRQSKLAKPAANDTVSNDVDDDINVSDRDHVACSSAASADSNSAVLPDCKHKKSRSNDRPRQRQNNRCYSYRNSRYQQTSAAEDSSTLAIMKTASHPSEGQEAGFAAAKPVVSERGQGNCPYRKTHPDAKSKTQSYQPRKHWCWKTVDKISRLSAGKEEELWHTADASLISIEESKGGDLQRESSTSEAMKDSYSSAQQKKANTNHTSTESIVVEQRRKNHARCNGGDNFAKETESHDQQTSIVDDSSRFAKRAQNPEQCQLSNFSSTPAGAETKSRKLNCQPRKHWNHKADRLSANKEEQLQENASSDTSKSVEAIRGGEIRTESTTGSTDESRKDTTSSAQQKKADTNETSIGSHRQAAVYQKRRNNHTRRNDDTNFAEVLVASHERQNGPDWADGSSSHSEKPYQRSRGNWYGARRNFYPRKNQSSNNQCSNDNRTVAEDRQTTVLSTRHHRQDSHLRDSGSCVQERPISAMAQLQNS